MRIILSHRHLDFDALASMMAAQKLFADAVLIIEGEPGFYVQEFIALAKEQLPYRRLRDLNLEAVEEVILVDTNDLARAVGNGDSFQTLKNRPLRIFDHHPYAEALQPNMVIEPVGATVTLLVERLIAENRNITSFEATLMMLGVYDDTGSLLFESTTARDADAVAFLLRRGGQLSVVAEYLHRPLSSDQIALFQQILNNGVTERIQGVPIYISYAVSERYSDGLAILAHRVGEIESSDIWFILVQMDRRVHIVARSRDNEFAVNRITQAFGGSGHLKAASATVKGLSLEETIARLKEEIGKVIREPHLVRAIMSYPVKTVTSETKMEEIGQILLRYGHTGMPVVDDGQLKGIISRRDVDKALRYGLTHAPVKGYMTREVVTVAPDAPWEEVQNAMIRHNIGRVPVLEDNKLVGIVSRSDVLRLIYGRALPTTTKLALERSQAMRGDVIHLLQGLPAPLSALLDTVRDVAREMGLRAHLVGGFVRDLLLGVGTQDLDIVIEGDGVAVAERLSRKVSGAKLAAHEQFGTARIFFPKRLSEEDSGDDSPPGTGGWPAGFLKDSEPGEGFEQGFHIDIAGTRSETYAYPGALPTVEESSLEEDLFRRDFTINAMAICLTDNRFGELVDFYGGLRDLQQGEIRILHNLSFIDDPTRIMRALRFAGRYDFKLAPLTCDAAQTAMQAGVLDKVSFERFSEEFFLGLAEPEFPKIGRLLQQYEVLDTWFHARYPWTFRWNAEEDAHVAWALEKRWIAVLIEMEDREIQAVLQRMKLTKQWHKDTTDYLYVRRQLRSLSFNLERIDEILLGVPEWLQEVLALHQDLTETIGRYREAAKRVEMTTTGYDLLGRGIKEGPYIGAILRQIRTAWLTGTISSKADEEAFVTKILKDNSLEK